MGVRSLPILAIYLIALLASSVFSAGSLALGILAYLELPVPRPTSRRVELFVVSSPLLAGTILVAGLALSGA